MAKKQQSQASAMIAWIANPDRPVQPVPSYIKPKTQYCTHCGYQIKQNEKVSAKGYCEQCAYFDITPEEAQRIIDDMRQRGYEQRRNRHDY